MLQPSGSSVNTVWNSIALSRLALHTGSVFPAEAGTGLVRLAPGSVPGGLGGCL